METQHANLDKRFLLKYLALTQGKTNTTLDKYIPTAKGTTTLHSLVFNETPNQFHEVEANLVFMNVAETRQLVGWGISRALEVAYRNHYYTMCGDVHRQTDIGPHN